MSAIVNFDFLVDEFVDFTESFVWSQGPTLQTVVPVNLVGFTAQLMVRVTAADVVPLISISTSATSAGSIAITVPSGGTVANLITVTITAAALSTSGITGGLAAFYDLILTQTDGTKVKFATGNIRVAPTYTH